MDDRVRQEGRVPLKEVVADGTRRWFQDALKEARVGDAAMQVLVGQMHHSGYAGGIALKHAVRDVIMEVGFRCHATSAHMVEALALLEGFKQARRCLQHFESTRIPSRFIAQV
ncbi:hypothetical protein MUK42_16168 [Musa troglodytarum]|uniref:Uncharacterized protein n=1 Tax=Musa troglodytarum TaxID=320322 RepID=A0A9E7I425_9LILI|nr:hypothetical protein MUK42_16168 [Musa troglodytarum]